MRGRVHVDVYPRAGKGSLSFFASTRSQMLACLFLWGTMCKQSSPLAEDIKRTPQSAIGVPVVLFDYLVGGV